MVETWSATWNIGVPACSTASRVSSRPSSKWRPLATISGALSIRPRSCSEGWKAWGSPPVGMRVTTSASPSQVTFATTSPHIDVVTTIVGTPSDSAASSSFPHPHATNASAPSESAARRAIRLELIMSPIPANLFSGRRQWQTDHSRGAPAKKEDHGGYSPRAVHHRPAHCDYGGGIRPPPGGMRMLSVLVEMPVRPS